MKKIAIIMPVFNTGEWLGEAVDSAIVAFQDLDFVLVLVDDKSTDEVTLAALSDYEKGVFPQVKVLRSDKNGGPARARNVGVWNSCSEWISFLDSDDLLIKEGNFSRQKVLDNYHSCDWVASDYAEMWEPGIISYPRHFQEIIKQEGFLIGNETFRVQNPLGFFARCFPLMLGTMMVKRDLYLKIGGIDERLIIGEDWHFSMKLATLVPMYFSSETSLIVRRHHASLTKNILKLAMEDHKAESLILRDLRFSACSREVRWRLAGLLRHYSEKMAECRNSKVALDLALKLIAVQPNDRRTWNALYKALRSVIM